MILPKNKFCWISEPGAAQILVMRLTYLFNTMDENFAGWHQLRTTRRQNSNEKWRAAAYVASHEHSISSAEEIAEKEISAIAGPLFHREDIGTDKLIQKRIDEMRKLREQ